MIVKIESSEFCLSVTLSAHKTDHQMKYLCMLNAHNNYYEGKGILNCWIDQLYIHKLRLDPPFRASL